MTRAAEASERTMSEIAEGSSQTISSEAPAADGKREFEPPVERPGARVVRRKRAARPRVRVSDPLPADLPEPSLVAAADDDTDAPLGGYSYTPSETGHAVLPSTDANWVWLLIAPLAKVVHTASERLQECMRRLWRHKLYITIGATGATIVIAALYYKHRRRREVHVHCMLLARALSHHESTCRLKWL